MLGNRSHCLHSALLVVLAGFIALCTSHFKLSAEELTQPNSKLMPLINETRFEKIVEKSGISLFLFRDIIKRLSEGTHHIPGIHEDLLKGMFIDANADLKAFYNSVYLYVSLGMKLKLLLTNLFEADAMLPPELVGINDVLRNTLSTYLAVYPSLFLQTTTYFKQLNDETFTNQIKYAISRSRLVESIITQRKDIDELESQLKLIDAIVPAEERKTAHREMSQLREMMTAQYPIMMNERIREFIDTHPKTLLEDRFEKSDEFNQEITGGIREIKSNIIQEFLTTLPVLELGIGMYLDSSIRRDFVGRLSYMSPIVSEYEFLKDAWVELALAEEEYVRSEEKKQAALLGGTIVLGIFARPLSLWIGGVRGLSAAGVLLTERSIVLASELIFTASLASDTWDTYQEYKTKERQVYTGVLNQGVVAFADYQHSETRLKHMIIWSSVGLGMSALQVGRILKNPATRTELYRVVKNDVIPGGKNIVTGGYKGLTGKPIKPPKPLIGFNRGGHPLYQVKFGEKLGYYTTVPINFLLKKGWGFLRFMKSEVPRGAIYGATGTVLAILVYEHITESTFEIWAWMTSLLGDDQPTSRIQALTLNNNTRVLRDQRNYGIIDVDSLIGHLRDWENQILMLMVGFNNDKLPPKDRISEEMYTAKMAEYRKNIEVRLWDFGRKYYEYIESRDGIDGRLLDYQDQLRLEVVNKKIIKITFKSVVGEFTAIYDANNDNSPVNVENLDKK